MNQEPQTWRVLLEDGTTREIVVDEVTSGSWRASDGGVSMESSTTARTAIVHLAGRLRLPVVEIVAPGEPTRKGIEAMAAKAERNRVAMMLRDHGDDVVNDDFDYACAMYDAESKVLGERPVYVPRKSQSSTEVVASMLDSIRSIYASVAPERARLTRETFPTSAADHPVDFAALVALEVRDYVARVGAGVVDPTDVCAECGGVKAIASACRVCGGEVDLTRLHRKIHNLSSLLARVTHYENSNSHAHMRHGRWDRSNGPKGHGGLPCARCHAFADARVELGEARWSSPREVSIVKRAAESAEPYTCDDTSCGCGADVYVEER